jgi:O-antigen ligase
MPDQYKERFLSITDVSSETGAAESARGRLDGFINGLKMFTDRPLLGYGLGNFGVATGMVYRSGWLQAHSLPGQMLGEIGLLGSIAFIVWLYNVFRTLSQVLRRAGPKSKEGRFMISLATSLKVQLFCLLFMGLGGHNLYRYNWFIISAVAVIMLRYIDRQEQTDKSAAVTPLPGGQQNR